MVDWVEVSAIGSISLSAITIFAIFYPKITKWYNRPKFVLSKSLSHNGVKWLHIYVQNQGRTTAHNVVCLIKVFDVNNNIMLKSRLPFERGNEFIYDEIVMYPTQQEKIVCAIYGKIDTNLNKLIITSYPFKLGSNISPELTITANSDNKYFKIKIDVVCEENNIPTSYEFDLAFKDNQLSLI